MNHSTKVSSVYPASLLTAIRNRFRTTRTRVIAVVLITTAISLLFAGAAILSNDIGRYRDASSASLRTEAAMLGLATAPALAFDDQVSATRNLSALKARPEVMAAALYLPSGALYTQYLRNADEPPPPTAQPPVQSSAFVGQQLTVVHRIERNGELLGTLYIRARFDVYGGAKAYAGILAAVILVAMAIAWLLSSLLQRLITAPLSDMAGVARKIIEAPDYSLRAHKSGDDEIGVVVDAFNKMLHEVQARTLELQRFNAQLQREVATRETAETSLAHANARLNSNLAAAEIGSWIVDLRTQQFVGDRNLAALYGLDVEEVRGDAMFFQRFIHPDDLHYVLDQSTQFEAVINNMPLEFRIVRRDGSIRHVVARGNRQLDAQGKPTLLAGLLIDITAQKRAERALRESETLYRAIGESLNYGVWVNDATGRNTYASESFLKLIGLTQAECSAGGWLEALHPDDRQATQAAWEECARTGQHWYREHRFRGTDGNYHPVLAQGVAIRDASNNIVRWAGINLDISRLKQTEAALREADRRKDDFLATLAHELRNPLAPILSSVKILDHGNATAEHKEGAKQVITRQVQHMALLLDDLLDISRITSGRLELKPSRVDLASLLASAIETARPLIDRKRHTLTTHLPSDQVTLWVDPLRIAQALTNLLNNAAKYTHEGGHLQVSVDIQPQSAPMGISIAVQDNGIGLAPASLSKVFDMFSQVDSASHQAEGGLGIGLALAKGLITLHSGRLEAISDGLGKGSTFIMHLPANVLMASEPAVESDAASAAEQEMVAGCNIVVADDNRDAAQALALVLELAGNTVTTAFSGPEALQLCLRSQPRVAILDIGMPDMNGYEVAQQIRLQPWGREIYLVALSGWGQPADKQRALAAGFDHHFTKPVDSVALEQWLMNNVTDAVASISYH